MKRLYKITAVSKERCIIFLYFKVLVHIGEWGPYQKFLFFMLCIPACLPAAFIAFNQVGSQEKKCVFDPRIMLSSETI